MNALKEGVCGSTTRSKNQIVTGLMFWALAILFFLLMSCGSAPEQKEEPVEEPVSEVLMIRGSVTSAFQVVVDGVPYQDMEAYYSSDLTIGKRLGKVILVSGSVDCGLPILTFNPSVASFPERALSTEDSVQHPRQHSSAHDSVFQFDGSIDFRLPLIMERSQVRVLLRGEGAV